MRAPNTMRGLGPPCNKRSFWRQRGTLPFSESPCQWHTGGPGVQSTEARLVRRERTLIFVPTEDYFSDRWKCWGQHSCNMAQHYNK